MSDDFRVYVALARRLKFPAQGYAKWRRMKLGMSDSAMQASWRRVAERVEAALPRWAAHPHLLALIAPSGKMFLVFDMGGGRILHASKAAAPIRAAIGDTDGHVFPNLNLAAQVSRLGPLSERPKLARLRFDVRGIAPAVTCLVARAPLYDSSTALLIAPVGPLAGVRHPPSLGIPEAARPQPARALLPAAIQADAIVPPSSRLIWRSDDRDILTAVSGTSPDVISALEGRSWMALCSAGLAARSESAFTALTARRTFRRLSLILSIPGTGDEVEIDFSGTPSARQSQPFSGFSGFGTVRERRMQIHSASPTEASGGPSPEDPAGTEAAPGGPIPAVVAEAELAETNGVENAQATSKGAHTPLRGSMMQNRADLSSNEHDAFREIARALGARFAGDDEPDRPASLARESCRGSVTPFPMEAAAPPERKQDSDATVAGAFDRLPTGVLIHAGGTILFVNRWLLQLTGLADARAIETAGWLPHLGASAALAQTGRTIAVTSASGQPIDLQVEQSTIEWQGQPAVIVLVRRPLGRAAVAGLAADGTHGKRGIVTLDAGGLVLTLDSDAVALVPASRGDVVGEPFADLFPPESAAQIEESLRQAREYEASAPCEVEGRSGDAPISLSLRIARLLSTGETAYRATLEQTANVWRDADEQREALRRAEARSHRKFDYFAKAGQAIRAPISGILKIADALLDEQFGSLGNDHYRDHLRDLHGLGEEALSLVNDLVDLAKVDSGRINLAFTDVPLNEIVSGCIASIQPQAARERVVVRTSLSPDLKTLVADEHSMRQATMNVIANAVRFSDPGGQVIVTTTVADRGEIALRVRDTGAGLSSEEIEHALDPFRRDGGRLGSCATFGGGLGLTLSKALVEANHGQFTLTSRKNEGTLVEIVFTTPQLRTA